MRLPWFFAVATAVFLYSSVPIEAQVKEKAKDADAGKAFAIPFRLTDAGHIMVRAKINGKGPFNFIVDTGAPMLYVSEPAAKTLNLKEEKKKTSMLDTFQIEGGPVHKDFKCAIETPFQLEGMNALGIAGVELHGIIGYMFLAHYKMEIDLTKDRMTWTKLDFAPPTPVSVGTKEDASQIDEMAKMVKSLVALMGKKGPQAPTPRGFIGFELADKDGGVVVQSVMAKGPADMAGLAVGDRIVAVQGKKAAAASGAVEPYEAVTSLKGITELLATVTSGQEISFIVQRGAESRQVKITAGEGM